MTRPTPLAFLWLALPALAAGPAPAPAPPAPARPAAATPAAPATVRVPGYADWKARMLKNGRERAAHLAAHKNDPPDQWGQHGALGDTYYDATRVFEQIAAYTGDPKWYRASEDALTVYRDGYVMPSDGKVPGFWVFARGLLMHHKRTGDPKSKAAILALADHAAFVAPATNVESIKPVALSRETAYAIETMIAAEAVGSPRREQLAKYVDVALGHLEKMAPMRATGATFPFMASLTCEALIEYHALTADPRVLPAVSKVAGGVWSECWLPEKGSFKYSAMDTKKLPKSDPFYDKGIPEPSPDLSLLIAPVYAWLYHQTGDRVQFRRACAAFAGGVKGSTLANGKHYNQNYRWSFALIRWLASPPLAGASVGTAARPK